MKCFGPLLMIALLGILSCNLNKENIILADTKNAIKKSEKSVNNSSIVLLQELAEKSKAPRTAERASIWYPIAKKIDSLTEDIYIKIDALNNNLDDESKWNFVYSQLNSYKENVFRIDSVFAYHFKDNWQNFIQNYDSVYKADKSMGKFTKMSREWKELILTRWQNGVKLFENECIGYCDLNIAKLGGAYYKSSVLIAQFKNIMIISS